MCTLYRILALAGVSVFILLIGSGQTASVWEPVPAEFAERKIPQEMSPEDLFSVEVKRLGDHYVAGVVVPGKYREQLDRVALHVVDDEGRQLTTLVAPEEADTGDAQFLVNVRPMLAPQCRFWLLFQNGEPKGSAYEVDLRDHLSGEK